MESTFVINVGRQLGSGGKQIGLRLAQEFGIPCYDKELLNRAAQESGLCMERFEESDEKKGWLRHIMTDLTSLVGCGNPYSNPISEEALFHFQSETIRRMAEEQSCVFIGRCADYVLRDKARCANIFISADETDRVNRLRQLHHISEEKALQMIEQGDARRAKYYNFYSNNRWGEAKTYHLCINSSILGIEQTTEYIKEFICKKLKL